MDRATIEGTIAILVLAAGIGGEGMILWHGVPAGLDGVILGRILGTLDAAVMLVLTYYFGSTRNSNSQMDAIASIGKAAAGAPINITTQDTPQTIVATVDPVAQTSGTKFTNLR